MPLAAVSWPRGTSSGIMLSSAGAKNVVAMETAQLVLDLDGPGPEVNVSADVAALKVREIVQSMVADERGPQS